MVKFKLFYLNRTAQKGNNLTCSQADKNICNSRQICEFTVSNNRCAQRYFLKLPDFELSAAAAASYWLKAQHGSQELYCSNNQ